MYISVCWRSTFGYFLLLLLLFSRVQLFVTPMDCSTPVFPVFHHLLEFAQTHVHWVDDAIQPSYPLPPSSPPALNLSKHQGLFLWVGSWYQVAKMSFNFNIRPSNEYSGLISYRSDCFGLLAVQEALKSILQHHSSKASVLWHSAFFMVQLSNSCMTTGKAIALTIQTFISKVVSLLLKILVIKCLYCLICSKTYIYFKTLKYSS